MEIRNKKIRNKKINIRVLERDESRWLQEFCLLIPGWSFMVPSREKYFWNSARLEVEVMKGIVELGYWGFFCLFVCFSRNVKWTFGYLLTWSSDEKYVPKIQIWKSLTYWWIWSCVCRSNHLRLKYTVRTWKDLELSLRK